VDNKLRAYIRVEILEPPIYAPHYAVYISAVPVERLKDLNPSSSQAKALVNLIFWVKKGVKINLKSISRTFEVPKDNQKWLKLGLYNELEYRIYDTEP